MKLIGAGYHAFCHGMAVGYYEVVPRKFDLLNRERHQRQKMSIASRYSRDFGRKHGIDVHALQPCPIRLWKLVNEAEKIGRREQLEDGPKNLLRASIGDEPFVDDRNFQGGSDPKMPSSFDCAEFRDDAQVSRHSSPMLTSVRSW